MRICFLSSMHPPYDKRVFDKEAISLAQAGFDVIHLAPSNGEPACNEQGVQIITYPSPKGLPGRILQIPRLYYLGARTDADCYHCNEVDSWLVGALLKLSHRKKVVFDVHEHYPSNFAEHFPRWLHSLAAAIIRLLFRALTPFTDYIVLAIRSVSEGFRGAEQKQLLVQNFASLAHLEPQQPSEAHQAVQRVDAPVTAIHFGLIARTRGWPELLKALAQVKFHNIHLLIVGEFTDGSYEDFERCMLELGLKAQVSIEGWLPFEQAYQKLLDSHIGLILFQPGIKNHAIALPHKLFDYMMAGLPIIAPRFTKEIASIIDSVDCGILLDPSNPSEIGQALTSLAADPDERRRLGENGRRAVLEQYNWETEAKKLVEVYSKMARDVE